MNWKNGVSEFPKRQKTRAKVALSWNDGNDFLLLAIGAIMIHPYGTCFRADTPHARWSAVAPDALLGRALLCGEVPK